MNRVTLALLAVMVATSATFAGYVWLGDYHKVVTGVTILAGVTRIDTVAVKSFTSTSNPKSKGALRAKQLNITAFGSMTVPHADSMWTTTVHGCVNKQRVRLGVGDSVLMAPGASETGANVIIHNATDSLIVATRNLMTADSVTSWQLWWRPRTEKD